MTSEVRIPIQIEDIWSQTPNSMQNFNVRGIDFFHKYAKLDVDIFYADKPEKVREKKKKKKNSHLSQSHTYQGDSSQPFLFLFYILFTQLTSSFIFNYDNGLNIHYYQKKKKN
jgi:hypothetical protein